MIDFLRRSPFALLGAVALFNLVSDLIVVHEKVELWLSAWEAITRPIWDFLLGWLFRHFELAVPNVLKDYLTVGLVMMGSSFRTMVHEAKVNEYEIAWSDNLWPLWSFLFWPVSTFYFLRIYTSEGELRFLYVFLDTIVFTIILIGVSYAFLYAGP